MKIRGVLIEDTFAEAFAMRAARLIITGAFGALGARGGAQAHRLRHVGDRLQVRGGDRARAGGGRDARRAPRLQRALHDDGKRRPAKRLIERVGQTVLTCPTTACFDGLPGRARPCRRRARALRFFGDGFQASKVVGGQRYWRVPVMEGEFLVQEKFGMVKGVGGGNFLMLARSADAALEAAEAAVEAMSGRPASSCRSPAASCAAAARSDPAGSRA